MKRRHKNTIKDEQKSILDIASQVKTFLKPWRQQIAVALLDRIIEANGGSPTQEEIAVCRSTAYMQVVVQDALVGDTLVVFGWKESPIMRVVVKKTDEGIGIECLKMYCANPPKPKRAPTNEELMGLPPECDVFTKTGWDRILPN